MIRRDNAYIGALGVELIARRIKATGLDSWRLIVDGCCLEVVDSQHIVESRISANLINITNDTEIDGHLR